MFKIHYTLIILFLISTFQSCSLGSKKTPQSLPDPESDLASSLQLEVVKRTLDNGLTLLMVQNEYLPVFSYYTFYKVGGKFEKKGMTGATHFLEHLMFKGTKTPDTEKFDVLIESNGGSSNAYTTNDLTVYYESLPKTALNKIIQVEADRMVNLLIEPLAFEKERAVILEERKYRYENSPRGQLYLKMMEKTFVDTPYGTSVIGDIPDLKSVTREQIENYYQKYYAPNNAVVVVIGDIDPDDVYQQVKKYYGKLKSSDEISELIKQVKEEPVYANHAKWGKSYGFKGTANHPLFTYAYLGEPLGSRNSYVLDILSSILGEGDSSYLMDRYVTGKSPMLTNVYAANYTLAHAGVFFIGGELLSGVRLSQVQASFNKDWKNMCQVAIDERSVQKAKNQYLVSFFDELESNAGIASLIGLREVFFGDYSHYKKELEIYDSISVSELKTSCLELVSQKPIFLNVWKNN